MKNGFLAFSMLFSLTALAQQEDTTAVNLPPSLLVKSPIHIDADPRFTVLLEEYREQHKAEKSIKGYRIQIVSTTNRSLVYQAKGKFYSQFKDIPTYIEYQQPNFKLRVGNFRTKIEASRALRDINEMYKDAFIVKESLPLEVLSQAQEE